VNKKTAIFVTAIVLIVVIAMFAYNNRSDNKTQYQTAQVTRGDIRAQVEATGTINAVTTVQVGSQVSGTISKLYVDFNSQVKKGQLIAELDPTLFQGNVMQAQADYENAKANLAAAKANLEKAKATALQSRNDYNRTVNLTKEGVLSVQQLDAAKSAADANEAAISAAEAQVSQASAQVQQKAAQVKVAQTNLNYTQIYAPIDGTVINRAVDVGQTVAASLQAPTLFTIAQDLTKMLVYAKTDESDVGRIRPGQPVMFKVDAFPNETFRGQVQEVRMNATVVQNVVTYDTIVAFDNPDRKLFPGMTAYVTIPVARAQDVVKIPNGALRFKPTLDPKQLAELCQQYGVTVGACATGGRRASASADDVQQASRSASQSGTQNGPRAQAGAAQQGGNGGGARSAQGGQFGHSGQGGTGAAASQAVVWKLTADKSLQPVKVTTGITDFTFTELKDGGVNDGDQLVTGEIGGNRASNAPRLGGPGGGRPPGR
jgi:HlyD family secretion protein